MQNIEAGVTKKQYVLMLLSEEKWFYGHVDKVGFINNVQIYSLFGSRYHSGQDCPGLFDVMEPESEHDLMGTGVVFSQIGKGDIV
jgi:hypothetical protein